VIALEPEYILPQDGKEKQDCEIEAAKRWVGVNGDFYAQQGVTLMETTCSAANPLSRR